jgi:methionyl-tRNA synthetase
MSKSKGNVIYADELAEYFSVDGTRYYALAEMPYNADGTVTYENVITRYNNDLANNLGNLVSRTHAMTKKYFDGIVPEPDAADALDEDLKTVALEAAKKSVELMNSYRVADSLSEIFSMLRRANKYIDETMPWALAKTEEGKPRLKTVIYNLLEVIRIASTLLVPYIPSTAERIFLQLGTDKTDLSTAYTFGALESGKPLGEASTLFARIDEAKFLADMEAKRAAEAAAAAPIPEPEHEAEVGIEAFGALEIRAGEILACEPVPKAKKLLKLQIDLGYEKRQVVSGIAKFYKPEQLIGKKVCVIVNLKPAKLCGVDSYGMILASGEEDVKVVFLDESVKNGDRIR